MGGQSSTQVNGSRWGVRVLGSDVQAPCHPTTLATAMGCECQGCCGCSCCCCCLYGQFPHFSVWSLISQACVVPRALLCLVSRKSGQGGHPVLPPAAPCCCAYLDAEREPLCPQAPLLQCLCVRGLCLQPQHLPTSTQLGHHERCCGVEVPQLVAALLDIGQVAMQGVYLDLDLQ